VSQCREECRQLDGEPRLAPGGGAAAPGSALDGAARSLSQGIASLQARVGGDSEETAAVRGEVMSLLRHTDAAMHAFKRTHAWREAARAAPGQPLPSHVAEALGGPVALPSAFLGETVDRYGERLRAHQAAAADLEAALRQPGGGGGGGGPAAAAAALQASIANVHDCLLRAAARLQGVDDRVAAARAAHLARRRQAGDFSDPFEEAARAQAAAAAKVAARAQAEQQQQQQQQQAQLAQQQQQPGERGQGKQRGLGSHLFRIPSRPDQGGVPRVTGTAEPMACTVLNAADSVVGRPATGARPCASRDEAMPNKPFLHPFFPTLWAFSCRHAPPNTAGLLVPQRSWLDVLRTATCAAGFALLGAPPVQATPAASPAGLFGTLAPAAAAPAAAGGLFGNVAPPATGSASATTRRRAGRR
jgi:hypothetical protein